MRGSNLRRVATRTVGMIGVISLMLFLAVLRPQTARAQAPMSEEF